MIDDDDDDGDYGGGDEYNGDNDNDDDDDGWIDDWRQTHWLGAECTGWTPNEKATWPGAEWVRRSLLSKPQHHLAIVRTCKTDRLAGHVEEEP